MTPKFPKLDETEGGFAESNRRVIAFIVQVSGEQVCLCREMLGRIQMKDAMHFAQESAQEVATMYTCDLLRNLGKSDEAPSRSASLDRQSLAAPPGLGTDESSEEEALRQSGPEPFAAAEPCDRDTWRKNTRGLRSSIV